MYTLPYPFLRDLLAGYLAATISLGSLFFFTEPFHPSITQAKVLFVIYLGFSNAKVFLRKVKCRGLRTGSGGRGMDAVSAAAHLLRSLRAS